MFNCENYFSEENKDVEKLYSPLINDIKKINLELKDKLSEQNEYSNFLKLFFQISERILLMVQFEEDLNDNYFEQKSFEELKKFNYEYFKELLPEFYNESFANPVNIKKDVASIFMTPVD